MQIVTLSTHSNFFEVISKTAKDFEYHNVQITNLDNIKEFISNMEADLIIVDCQDYHTFDLSCITEELTSIENLYVLLVESVKHELDQDCLLAQITKQVKLNEIYTYQTFIKQMCFNFWSHSFSEFEEAQEDRDYKLFQEFQEFEKSKAQSDKYDDLLEPSKYSQLIPDDDPSNNILQPDEESNTIFNDSFSFGFNKLEPNAQKLFDYFKRNANQIISIEKLTQYMWGVANITKRNAIYVYIRKIRIFLHDDLENPKILVKTQKSSYKLVSK